jgi:hypothetical protein
MVYTVLKDMKVNFSTEVRASHSHKSGTSLYLSTIKRMGGGGWLQTDRKVLGFSKTDDSF